MRKIWFIETFLIIDDFEINWTIRSIWFRNNFPFFVLFLICFCSFWNFMKKKNKFLISWYVKINFLNVWYSKTYQFKCFCSYAKCCSKWKIFLFKIEITFSSWKCTILRQNSHQKNFWFWFFDFCFSQYLNISKHCKLWYWLKCFWNCFRINYKIINVVIVTCFVNKKHNYIVLK